VTKNVSLEAEITKISIIYIAFLLTHIADTITVFTAQTSKDAKIKAGHITKTYCNTNKY